MSVLKMIIADDRHYLCGEVHGSCAQWIYAACSHNPASLDELNRLLPEFGATESLPELFGHTSSLHFTPVDAGLIIVDLAKKWIFAEDTYFGAGRRGSYSLRDDEDKIIAYEFSEKWHFVAEAKWFNYLWSCELQPYGGHQSPAGDIASRAAAEHPAPQDGNSHPHPVTSREDGALAFPPPGDDFESGDEAIEDEAIWDEEMAGIDVEFANRWTALMDFEPRNAAETRELKTLEHILRYEQNAAVARHQIHLIREKIAALQIELQAVENLWDRTGDPRWEIKRTRFQTRIAQQEKHILRLRDEEDESAAMAAELRTFGITEKFHQILKCWADGVHPDRPDLEENIPF